MMNKSFRWAALFLVVLTACQPTGTDQEIADTILQNGNIYTASDDQSTAQAIAIKGDKILAVGSNEDMEAYTGEETETIDLEGQFVMPGFIEGHGHFQGVGRMAMNLNFLRSDSWDDIVAEVAAAAEEAEPGEWIIGRGWHQEKWRETPDRNVLGYPYHDELSEVSPLNPVLLRHASGHALFANAKAMQMAGITAETPNPVGGEIVRDSRGNPIGVFEENAEGLIDRVYNAYMMRRPKEANARDWMRANRLAQDECLRKGITSFQDAGSSYTDIERFNRLAENDSLDVRLYVMLRHSYDRMNGNLDGFPIINAGNNAFTCRAIKAAVDGALGSYGAWLLEPYEDKADFSGQNTTSVEELTNIAELSIENDMQYCVHAIGDRANREVLDIFEAQFEAHPDKDDLRWRIEHSQHLHPDDIPRFADMGVIAAMQAIHCTSDAPFVVKRLGEKRAKEGAYVWKSLLESGAVVTNGTDAPVEDVDPIESFYATVTRKRIDNGFEFFPEQALSREEAIKSYTLANAYAAFEEDIKGSLEPGKLADLVVLSQDLINCTEEQILETEVLKTMVGGTFKYEKE
jgi:predicted amidohydrolase YtcJ